MPSNVRQVGRLVFLLALALYIGTTGGSMATDTMSYEVTKGIVDHGTVAMSYNVFNMDAHRGADGRYYAPYGIGHAVYSIPFYALARLAERWTGLAVGKPEVLPKAGFVIGSAVAAALTVWLAFLFAWRLSANIRAAVKTALVLGFGTLLWPYAKFGFSAPLATLCVLVGTYGAWVGARFGRQGMLALGGVGLGAALLVRHEMAILCLPVALWLIVESQYDWRTVLRRCLATGLPVVAALVVTIYYNAVRFGNPLDTGYLRDETLMLGSMWVGLVGLLVSPGRSVFLYSPITLAGLLSLVSLRHRDSRTLWLFAGESIIVLLFYASFANWDAERSYGPRYLLPIIPLLVLPLSAWFATNGLVRGEGRARLLTALAVLSVLVQVPAILVDFSKVGAGARVGYPTMHQRDWTWQASGLSFNTRASIAAIPVNLKYLSTGERPAVRPAPARARDFSDQFAFSFDFWWMYFYYLGAISAPVAVALGGACLGAAVFFGSRLLRLVPADGT